MAPRPGRVIGGTKAQAFINRALAAQTGGVGGVEVGIYGPEAKRAAINEFGTSDGHVPERPFFRRAIKRVPAVVVPLVRARISTVTMAVNQALAETIGEAVEGVIVGSIRDLKHPPNDPATIARKGGADPLVATGGMAEAVGHRVLRGPLPPRA